MRLLVSVRSAAEVGPALTGGADIIDAKEPARGSLGPVDLATLAAIAAELPPAIALSVALGDLTAPAEVERTIHQLPIRRHGELFLKLGFAGLPDNTTAQEILDIVVATAQSREHPPTVVAVAYADHALA